MVDGTVRRYESLVCSNIDRMSKVLTMSKNASVTDGKFELNAVGHRSIKALLTHLLTASTVGLDAKKQFSRYTFRSLQTLSIQSDGEVFTIPKDSDITITCEPGTLHCII